MITMSKRNEFTVEMITRDGAIYRKISPYGGWTTYSVEPMTLDQAEAVVTDFNARGTTATYRIVDMFYDAMERKYGAEAKAKVLADAGYDDKPAEWKRELGGEATALRKKAIEAYKVARDEYLTLTLHAMYCAK